MVVTTALLITAAISAAASIASAAIQNNQNKEIMEQQQEWQEEMMDKQNEYNTPANQMARLEDAGINPATIGMASGSVQGGNLSASPGNYSTFPASNLLGNVSGDLGSLMNAFKSGEEGLSEKTLRQQRLDNLEAQTEQLLASANSLNVSSAGQEIINRYIEAEKEFGLKGFQANLDLTYQQIAELKTRTASAQYQLENVFPAEVKKLLSEANVNYWDAKQVLANIEKISAEKENIDVNTDLAREKITTEQIAQEGGDLQNRLTGEQLKYYSDITERYLQKLDEEIKNIAAQTGLTEEQAYWYMFDVMGRNSSKLDKFFNSSEISREVSNRKRLRETGYFKRITH